MNFYRETIKNAPPVIQVPTELRNRDVEVIILPFDEDNRQKEESDVERDEMGYPLGFFESTAGSIPDFPERRAATVF